MTTSKASCWSVLRACSPFGQVSQSKPSRDRTSLSSSELAGSSSTRRTRGLSKRVSMLTCISTKGCEVRTWCSSASTHPPGDGNSQDGRLLRPIAAWAQDQAHHFVSSAEASIRLNRAVRLTGQASSSAKRSSQASARMVEAPNAPARVPVPQVTQPLLAVTANESYYICPQILKKRS